MNRDEANKRFAQQKRAEAKKLLNRLLGLSPAFSNMDVDQLLDAIIAAAVMEATLVANDLNKQKEKQG